MDDGSAIPAVLIVEDHRTWQMVFFEAVPDTYDVELVASVTRAYQSFDRVRDRVVLIILDGAIGGNELNTLELIRYIRSQGYTGPIIAASDEYNDQMVEAGCSDRAQKPQVFDLIEQLLAA